MAVLGQIFKYVAGKPVFWLSLVTLLILIIYVASYDTADITEYTIESQQTHPLLEDKDGDGLSAWEEELYGTNPQVMDTDGDGVSDGDEIRQGKNPLLRGEANVANTSPEDEIDDIALSKPINLTQELIDELVKGGGIATILEGGRTNVPSQIISQKIDTLTNTGALPSSPRIFSTLENLKTSDDTSNGAIRNYLNSAAESFIKHIAQFKKDDLDLFFEIVQSGNIARLSELGAYRVALEKIAVELRLIAVPKNLTWFHSREIQYLEESARQIGFFENAETDPVSALVVLPERIDLKIKIITFHAGELRKWLADNAIQLQTEDNAHYLIN